MKPTDDKTTMGAPVQDDNTAGVGSVPVTGPEEPTEGPAMTAAEPTMQSDQPAAASSDAPVTAPEMSMPVKEGVEEPTAPVTGASVPTEEEDTAGGVGGTGTQA